MTDTEREVKDMKWSRKAVKGRDIEFIMNLLESDWYEKNGSVFCLTKSGLNKLSMEDLGNLRSMLNEALQRAEQRGREEKTSTAKSLLKYAGKIDLTESDDYHKGLLSAAEKCKEKCWDTDRCGKTTGTCCPCDLAEVIRKEAKK